MSTNPPAGRNWLRPWTPLPPRGTPAARPRRQRARTGRQLKIRLERAFLSGRAFPSAPPPGATGTAQRA
eukprot:9474760-Pyramimonas_sp.AAC.1